ncbi:MAG: hypothetical protein ACOYOS_22565 [Syntrophales bacterium]
MNTVDIFRKVGRMATHYAEGCPQVLLVRRDTFGYDPCLATA